MSYTFGKSAVDFEIVLTNFRFLYLFQTRDHRTLREMERSLLLLVQDGRQSQHWGSGTLSVPRIRQTGKFHFHFLGGGQSLSVCLYVWISIHVGLLFCPSVYLGLSDVPARPS